MEQHGELCETLLCHIDFKFIRDEVIFLGDHETIFMGDRSPMVDLLMTKSAQSV